MGCSAPNQVCALPRKPPLLKWWVVHVLPINRCLTIRDHRLQQAMDNIALFIKLHLGDQEVFFFIDWMHRRPLTVQ